MKNNTVFIGIDVSKTTLDVCIVEQNEKKVFLTLKNKEKAIGSFCKKIAKKYATKCMKIAMENTGHYNWNTYAVLDKLDIELYVINPLHLKRSMGLVRGKNDKVDSERIADFLIKNNTLKPFKIPQKGIRKMQILVAQRNRLVNTKKSLLVAVKEVKYLDDKVFYKMLEKENRKLEKVLIEAIKETETQLQQIIEQDLELTKQYHLITSVPGVGKVVAWELLIKTNAFKSISDPRKLACYSGVVPFEYQSGTSVFKRPRVSVYADRKLKKLLHMAALRVIQIKGELQTYYLRKVAEGKNKMLVINALRNKIVQRVCAVIKNQTNYTDFSLQVS